MVIIHWCKKKVNIWNSVFIKKYSAGLADTVTKTSMCTWADFGLWLLLSTASWMKPPKYRDGLKDNVMSRRKREINVEASHSHIGWLPCKIGSAYNFRWISAVQNYTAVLLWTKEQINLRLFESTELIHASLCCSMDIVTASYWLYFCFLKVHALRGNINSPEPEQQWIKVGWTMLGESPKRNWSQGKKLTHQVRNSIRVWRLWFRNDSWEICQWKDDTEEPGRTYTFLNR